MNFLTDHMMGILDRHNNAIGGNGNAGDIISKASFEQDIKLVENSQTNSIFNKRSISGEEISFDSDDVEVIMKRNNHRLFNIQLLWIIMIVIFFGLTIFQLFLFLNKN